MLVAWLLFVISALLLVECRSAVVPSDFLLDIDGGSLMPDGNICVLEYKHGVDVGGRIKCEKPYRKRGPPDDVSVFRFLVDVVHPRAEDLCATGGWNFVFVRNDCGSGGLLLGHWLVVP